MKKSTSDRQNKMTKADLHLVKVLKAGVRSVLRKQVKLGYPLAVMRNGKAVIIPAKDVKW